MHIPGLGFIFKYYDKLPKFKFIGSSLNFNKKMVNDGYASLNGELSKV